MTHNPQSTANTPPDNTPVSSTPDQRIDQVLAGLRAAKPATGLETRLLDRIHARLAEARVSEAAAAQATNTAAAAAPSIYATILHAIESARIFSSPATRYSFAAASLAAVAAVSIFAVHSHHRSSAQTTAAVIEPHLAVQHLPVQHLPPQNLPVKTIASVEGAGLQSRRVRHIRNAALAAEATTPSQPSTDPDAIALAETLAPSHPAPPMPLTEQERLLMSVARTGDKEEMTALNPVQREALYKQDQEAFQKFFAPPAPQKPILEAKNGATNDPHTDTR